MSRDSSKTLRVFFRCCSFLVLWGSVRPPIFCNLISCYQPFTMIEGRKRNAMNIAASSLLTILLIFGANSAKGENNSCSMVERLHGEMVNIKTAKQNAEKNNGIVSVPKALKVNSSEDCEQGCCGNVNCTVYLFYPHPPSNKEHSVNCFFLNCRPQSLCSLVNVSSKAQGAVVGIRELPAGNAVEPRVSANLASVSTVQPVTSQKESSTSNPTVTAKEPGKTMTTVQTEASTTSAPLNIKKPNDDNNHTTNGSLIIALGFGILFFLAVVVLIGRPWWQSFHRPRYSKVDYLMNGL